MSIATEAPEGLDSATLPDPATTAGDAPVPVRKCPDECPCGVITEGHVLGGLPFVVTVTMSVAGLPPIDVADLHGQIGKVVAGPPLVSSGTDDAPYRELENIRSLEVVGPTFGEIYRATAVSLAEAIPGLHKMADEADAGTTDDARETGTTAEAEAPACAGEQGARCPGGTGPLAGGEAAGHVDTPEASPRP